MACNAMPLLSRHERAGFGVLCNNAAHVDRLREGVANARRFACGNEGSNERAVLRRAIIAKERYASNSRRLCAGHRRCLKGKVSTSG